MASDPALILQAATTAGATIFLLALPLRLRELRRSPTRGDPGWQELLTAALSVILSAVLSSHWAQLPASGVQYAIITLLVLFAASLTLLGLSYVLSQGQWGSHRASDLATLYLLACILCDIVYLTLLYKDAAPANTSKSILLRCCVYLVLFGFEGHARTESQSAFGSHQSPEETHGILDRVLFTWINPLILRGYKSLLVCEELPPLSQDLKSDFTRRAILQAWSERVRPETLATLPLALLKALRTPFLASVIPRLFLIAFRYSQPPLIKNSIIYVKAYSSDTENDQGFWLVVSSAVVYVGLAVSTGVYQHSINRMKLMTKSALVGLIHHKAMESPSIGYENSEAITLMSTDASSLDGVAEMFHETWAQLIEVLFGVILLAHEVGWIWPLPLFLIYLCSHMSRFVAKHLQPRQKAWNSATQNRITTTSSVLSSIKVVKMLGFQNHLTRRIRELRNAELWTGSKLRWVTVYYNASANALGIFSPAITLVIFAVISSVQGHDLDTETAFTTVAILLMITHPANMIMTIVPRAVASLAGFERIQIFLLRPHLQAKREIPPPLRSSPDKVSWDRNLTHLVSPGPAIQVKQLKIGDGNAIIENISLDLVEGSFNILSGATGSGKSTLLRAILGEVVPTHGSVSLATQKVAYCSQRPWLPNGNIREVIYGQTSLIHDHELWYQEVLKLCCLTRDFDSLPDGDQTQIGSRGLNLSGGQKQRVALARALFARSDILLLDDTFSGLDGETEQTIFDNLFGFDGLIRRFKTTVLLASNSSQYFHAADNIIVLGNRTVLDHGTWQEIKIKAASTAKFSSRTQARENALVSANFNKLAAQLRAKDETQADLARHTGDLSLYNYYYSFIGWVNMFLLVTTTSVYAFFITIPQYWLQLWTEAGGKNTGFYTTGYLFLSFMSWLSTSLQVWSLGIRLAPQSGSRLHQHLLNIVMSAPLSYFSQTDNGSILNRFSQDILLIDTQLPSALQTVVVQVFKLLMQVVVLCMAQKWLALFLPACGFVVYAVQKVYLRTSRQLRFLELQSRAQVFSSFLESIEGLETIRSFGWTEAAIQDNIQCVDNSQRSEFVLLCLQRWLNIVLDLLTAAIATSLIAVVVALREHISGAQVGIVLNIMLVTNTTLLKLVESWTTLETSIGAIARLKMLEKTTPREDTESLGLEPADNWPSGGHVEFKNIIASYKPESLAIRNLSLNIAPGQKVIVCGRTGSGKSTLLSTLLRLLELQSGKIELDGLDIKRIDLDLLRRRCFVAVSQDYLLLSNETLRFNLDPEAGALDDAIVTALAKVGLQSHFFGSNADLDKEVNVKTAISGSSEHSVLDRKISQFQELSVGQYQLFAVCRALIKVSSLRRSGIKPVVLLDEVTSSLDTSTESTIYRIIDDEFSEKGHTVIIVAHRLGALEKYAKNGRDAVVLLADGRLQEVIRDLRPATFQRLGRIE
ncbi:putative ABC transporter [Nemania sp. FL0031]|nr:putative ABC transporter [Nemania sp. FL0031]